MTCLHYQQEGLYGVELLAALEGMSVKAFIDKYGEERCIEMVRKLKEVK